MKHRWIWLYVADFTRMHLVPTGQRESYAAVAAGAIAKNVYLFAASDGWSTVILAWIDRAAIADALGLVTVNRYCYHRQLDTQEQ